MFDIIIVGSGFCGAVISKLASDNGKKVLLIEKRKAVGGNMRDRIGSNGVIVHLYGPHIFHTEDDEVYEFVSQNGNWYNYKVTYAVDIDGRCLDAPFGFHTIENLYDSLEAEMLKEILIKSYPDRDSITILELLDNRNPRIHAFAEFLFQKNYVPYAQKQWNLPPEKLDKSVIGRMPIIFEKRKYYFNVKHELLPVGGYSLFFEKMLKQSNIKIELNSDASKRINANFNDNELYLDGVKVSCPLVYTGRIDELLFSTKEALPFRSLRFDYNSFDREKIQNTAIMTFPQKYDYLRVTDYNQLMEKPGKKTTVSYEYPVAYNANEQGLEPYYPILTEENIKENARVQERAKKFRNLFPCGRLADYKYYNMDQAIKRSIQVYKNIESIYWK